MGRTGVDWADLSPSTHYFLQSVCADARRLSRNIDWSDVCHSTSGSGSLSKHEVAIKLAVVEPE